MAIPGSGNPLVMGKIYQELDGAGYSASADPNEIVTLSGLVGGQPDTINQASASKPNTSTPHSMSEWYSYNHSASSFTWGTPGTFSNTFFDAEMVSFFSAYGFYHIMSNGRELIVRQFLRPATPAEAAAMIEFGLALKEKIDG